MNRLITYLILAITIAFTPSCSTIKGWRDNAALKAGYVTKARAEGLLEQTKAEYDKKLKDNARDIDAQKEKVTQGLRDQMTYAAGKLYAADFAFNLLDKPDRTHLVMDNKVNEARAVLPAPSAEVIAAENVEIKRQLDEAKTTMAQLQIEHDAALKVASDVTAKEKLAEQALVKAEQDKINIQADRDEAVQSKQDDLNKANNKVIVLEHKRGDDADARHAAIEKLSWGAGVLAALCLAGAIWSPVFKHQFIIAGLVLGVSAVGIWYLTPLVVLSIAGIGGAIVIVWATRNHSKDNAAAMSTYQALADVKDKNPDLWNKEIAPKLLAWQTKYVKIGGEIKEVPDKTIAQTIDQKLASVGDK